MVRSDEERFQAIYVRHRGAVSAYLRRRAPAEVVDDVLSETFLICWRRLADVPAEPLPWLYAVARKTLANERRRRSHTPSASSVALAAASTAGPEESMPVGDLGLATAFEALSEGDREVLRLIAWEHVSLRDTAVVLGCSALACRVRFHRAKRRLAAGLDSFERAGRPQTHPSRTEGATRCLKTG